MIGMGQLAWCKVKPLQEKVYRRQRAKLTVMAFGSMQM